MTDKSGLELKIIKLKTNNYNNYVYNKPGISTNIMLYRPQTDKTLSTTLSKRPDALWKLRRALYSLQTGCIILAKDVRTPV